MNDTEGFSENEAPTLAVPDRVTPDFQAPSGLLRLAATPAEAAEPPEPEREFWESAPRYSNTSVRPAAPPSLAPSPRGSRPRRVTAQVLFALLFTGVLALGAYELSTLYGSQLSSSWSSLATNASD